MCFIMSQDPKKAGATQEVERLFLVGLSGLWAARRAIESRVL